MFNYCSHIATRIFIVIVRSFSDDTTIFHIVVTLYFPLTFQDSTALVCKPFIAKIHKLLKQHAIPSKYACAFAIAASDSLENVRDEVSADVLLEVITIVHYVCCLLTCYSSLVTEMHERVCKGVQEKSSDPPNIC